MTKMYAERSSNESKHLVQHHIKYKEIDGVDEIILMGAREHKKLHQHLRQTGQCKIPPKILAKISRQAHQRTDKAKITAKVSAKNYRGANLSQIRFSDRTASNLYLREDVGYNERTGTVYVSSYFYMQKKYPEYASKRQSLIFTETVGENIRLFESITLNGNTDQLSISSFFAPSNGHQLREVDEFDE